MIKTVPESAGEVSTDRSRSHLKVCLATPLFHPEYGGAAVRFRRYAPGLRARGIHMHVVAAEVGAWKSYRQYSTPPAESGATLSDADLPVQRVPIPRARVPRRIEVLRNRWIYESAVVDWCRDRTNRPDVVIWLELTPMSALNLMRLRREGIPMVSVDTMFSHPTGPGWKLRLKRLVWPLRYRLVDCVVVSSGVMRDAMREFGVDTRVEVVPHGVDLTRFKPRSASLVSLPLRQKLGIGAQDELVLFVGPINERKGLDCLAAAWDRVADERRTARLVIVGPERAKEAGEASSFGEGLRATLARGRGAERVIFVGPVDNVEEYLRAADLFVFPSRREGMPNVVCEAFASGLPCILTPFVGLPDEFGRPGREYVLVPHDAEVLARSIVDLLSDPVRRRALGGAARRWAEENLDMERSLDRYAAICRELGGS